MGYGVSLAVVVLDGSDGQQASCFDTGGNLSLGNWRVIFSVLVLVRLYEVGRWTANAGMYSNLSFSVWVLHGPGWLVNLSWSV